MKIVCENCGAKYSIADEKIKGKIFKIRCKKCNESIVIRGDAQAEVAAAAAPMAAPPPMPAADVGADDGDAETRVFDYSGYQQGGASASAGGEAVWHIVVEGNQQGPYTTDQIKEYLAGGNLDWEMFIWREGFDDWKPIRDVADFSGGAPAAQAPAAVAARPFAAAPAAAGGGLFDAPASGGGGLFDSPAASGGGLFDAPAGGGGGLFDSPAAAAPKAGGLFDAKPAGGLFGGGAAAATPGDVFSSAPSSGAGGDAGGLFGGGGGGGGGAGGGGLFDGAEGGGDLFGESQDAEAGGGGIFSSAGAGAPAAASPRVSAAQSMMTGQRNENSVLFSLSNLQALASSAEAPAAKSSGGFSMGGEASGLIDIRSMASSMGGAEKTGLDDLISIGGGGFAPSLGAPVLAAQHSGMSTGAKIGIIGGGVAVLIAAVIVVVVLLQPEEPVAPTVNNAEMEALKAQIAALTAKGGDQKGVDALKDKLSQAEQDQVVAGSEKDTAATDGEKTGETKKAGETKKGGETKKVGSGGGGGGGSKDKGETKDTASGGSGGSAAASTDTGTKPKKGGVDELDDLLGGSGGSTAKKKEEPKAGGGATGGGSAGGGGGGALPAKLERSQVQAGMNAVAGAVSKCGQGQTGTVTVQATIAATGRVTSATTTGTFAGTPAGLCAARAVRGARFPQTQNPLTVTYPFKF